MRKLIYGIIMDTVTEIGLSYIIEYKVLEYAVKKSKNNGL